jgi:ribonucleoside-diphosphate reductase alpha chain
MNKLVSQAIKKAVSEYKSTENLQDLTKDKRPDLFSLNSNTELFQNLSLLRLIEVEMKI